MPENSNVASTSVLVTLRRWRVMEIVGQDGTQSRHILGHDEVNNMGRASSAIKEFNPETMIVATNSGSHYKLVGLPGNSRIGRHVWKRWCEENGVVSDQDVTTEYFNIDLASTLDFEKIHDSLIPQDNL